MNRVILIVVGLVYVLTGAALLFAPVWFFDNVGTFPPFNRHYLGDLGAFTLPIGAGLLLAARNPVAGRGALLIGVLGSLVHLLNHVYDAAMGTVPGRGWSDVPGLAVVTLLLIVPWLSLGGWRRNPALEGAAVRE